MRGFLFLLVVVIGVGAWYTRPPHGLHRGVASLLMTEGRVARPESVSGGWVFDDFYVVTRSSLRSGDREVMECWGFFTRFLCIGAPPKVDVPVTG